MALLARCSVSRSVEEAALDDEWPGAPLVAMQQTLLSAHFRPAPATPTPPPAPPPLRARAPTPAAGDATPVRRIQTRAVARARGA
tara:strand:- start:63 stop:317 length:255 start_codon:yes stop_codon:yes gene_type:complete